LCHTLLIELLACVDFVPEVTIIADRFLDISFVPQ
jgi:hypothetical protein